MRLRLGSRALEDIADIRDYLLPRSSQGAENVRRAIIEDFDLLEQFPHSGRSTDIPGIRVLPVVRYPYLIYHTVNDGAGEIVIVHIRHSSRNAPAANDF